MTDESRKRRPFIEREEPAKTPEEARARRSRLMVGLGAIALVWGAVVVIAGGSGPDGAPLGALLLAIVGALVLVGGLILRR